MQTEKTTDKPTSFVPDNFLESMQTFATGYNSRLAGDETVPEEVRIKLKSLVALHLNKKFPINAFKDFCRQKGTAEFGNIAASKLLKIFRSMKAEAQEKVLTDQIERDEKAKQDMIEKLEEEKKLKKK